MFSLVTCRLIQVVQDNLREREREKEIIVFCSAYTYFCQCPELVSCWVHNSKKRRKINIQEELSVWSDPAVSVLLVCETFELELIGEIQMQKAQESWSPTSSGFNLVSPFSFSLSRYPVLLMVIKQSLKSLLLYWIVHLYFASISL